MKYKLVVVFSFAIILMISMIVIEWTLNINLLAEPLNNNLSQGSKTSSLANISIITPWNTGNTKDNGVGAR
jgi:hypothetical protein